jgi:hypothetical protein
MNYFDILLQTWKTLWKHKSILGFGLMTALIPGVFGIVFLGLLAFAGPNSIEQFALLIADYPYVWFAVNLAIGLISFLVAIIGYAGIIKGTVRTEGEAAVLPFGTLWDEAWPFVGRVAGLLLLIGVGMGIVFAIPALLGVFTAGVAFLCLFPLICLMFPLAILMQAFLSLAMSAAVADDLGVFTAIGRAWRVLAGNFWPVAIMAVILYLLQLLVSMLLSSPLFLLQTTLMPGLMQGAPDPQEFFALFGKVALVVLPVMLVVQGFILTYMQSAWTLTYLRLTRPVPAVDSADPAGPVDLSV